MHDVLHTHKVLLSTLSLSSYINIEAILMNEPMDILGIAFILQLTVRKEIVHLKSIYMYFQRECKKNKKRKRQVIPCSLTSCTTGNVKN